MTGSEALLARGQRRCAPSPARRSPYETVRTTVGAPWMNPRVPDRACRSVAHRLERTSAPPGLQSPLVPRERWAEREIIDVYEDQFDVWVKPDGVTPLAQPSPTDGKTRRCKPVPYWAFAKNQAQVLLTHARSGNDYVLSEAVHCKSAKEHHVDAALDPCAGRYLRDLLEQSPASVVAGSPAVRAFARAFTGLGLETAPEAAGCRLASR